MASVVTTDYISDLPADGSTPGILTAPVAVGEAAAMGGGDLPFPGDLDWYGIALNSSTTYLISIAGNAPMVFAGMPLPGSYQTLAIFDASGALLWGPSNADVGTDLPETASVQFTPGYTGTYYLQAGVYEGATGYYSLSVAVIQTVPQLGSGSDGNDHWVGGDDSDSYWGGLGSDAVWGLAGDDACYGNLGDDNVFGGHGNDRAFGGQGNDAVYGNLGHDMVYGNLGADILFGGQGNDALYGGRHDDILYGNLGDDQLWGNLGGDVMYGGAGADLFHVGNGADTIVDFDYAAGDRLHAANSGGATVVNADDGIHIDFGGGNVVTLLGDFTAEDYNSAWYA